MPTKEPAPRVYSYARFSSKQQAKGDSLTRQAEARDKWLTANGLTLEEHFQMTDPGVSSFRGANQENPERNALAAFLENVNKGKVPRGSYLIVESLDRLTRQDIRPALTLLLNLIEAGVRVVQLLPVTEVYDESAEPMKLMMAVMELSRGHSESKVKSKRVGDAWGRRKEAARTDRKVITRECPAWLDVVDGKYVLRKRDAESIRRIYALAADGNGQQAILRRLRADKVPPIGGAAKWSKTTISVLLRTRRVVGEYQPMRGTGGTGSKGRKPDGPPIPNFYPQVVTEDEWAAARLALEARRTERGPAGKTLFVFGGILKDARDGAPIYRTDKGAKNGGAKLVNSRAMTGADKGAKYVTFPAGPFEREVLKRLKEVDPREVLPGAGGKNATKVLETRRASIETRLAKIRGQMVQGDEDVAPLVAVVRELQTELDDVSAKLAEADRKAATPTASAWADYANVYDAMMKAPDKKDARARARLCVRRIVSEVHCLFVGSGMTRLAAVRVDFRGGGHRDYIIRHRAAHGVSKTPAKTESESARFEDKRGGIDLSNPEHAPRVERFLAELRNN